MKKRAVWFNGSDFDGESFRTFICTRAHLYFRGSFSVSQRLVVTLRARDSDGSWRNVDLPPSRFLRFLTRNEFWEKWFFISPCGLFLRTMETVFVEVEVKHSSSRVPFFFILDRISLAPRSISDQCKIIEDDL